MRFAVFASGNGSNFEAIAESIKQSHCAELVLLVTDKDCFAIERAKKYMIPTFLIDTSSSRRIYELETLKVLKKHNVEFIALAGDMNIVGPTLLEAFPNRVVNIHPSLLPKYKGLDTHPPPYLIINYQ